MTNTIDKVVESLREYTQVLEDFDSFDEEIFSNRIDDKDNIKKAIGQSLVDLIVEQHKLESIRETYLDQLKEWNYIDCNINESFFCKLPILYVCKDSIHISVSYTVKFEARDINVIKTLDFPIDEVIDHLRQNGVVQLQIDF